MIHLAFWIWKENIFTIGRTGWCINVKIIKVQWSWSKACSDFSTILPLIGILTSTWMTNRNEWSWFNMFCPYIIFKRCIWCKLCSETFTSAWEKLPVRGSGVWHTSSFGISFHFIILFHTDIRPPIKMCGIVKMLQGKASFCFLNRG